MIVIGIAGGKGTGKDTVANCLVESHGFQRFAFGDPIKEALATMFRVDVALFHNEALKEVPSDELFGHTPRYLMQTLGTEWGRDKVSATLWSDLLVRKLGRLHYRGIRKIVVPDVRFPSETKAIYDLGGFIWRVDRVASIYASGDGHRSEQGIGSELVSHHIDNNGTKSELIRSIGDLLDKTFSGKR